MPFCCHLGNKSSRCSDQGTVVYNEARKDPLVDHWKYRKVLPINLEEIHELSSDLSGRAGDYCRKPVKSGMEARKTGPLKK